MVKKEEKEEGEKMEKVIIALPFVLAFGLLILIRVLAGKDNGIGRLCRWYWNTSFKLAAYIPLCGWMAHFIIGEEKEIYIPIGKATDDLAYDALADAAERHQAEKRRQEAVRRELATRGYTDVVVNSDSSLATAKDKKGNSYTIHITDK